MNWTEALNLAVELWEKGSPVEVTHPSLNVAIKIDRDGTVRFGLFSTGLKVTDMYASKAWEVR